MSKRYLGGFITTSPTTPTTNSASGTWTLEQQFQYVGAWPFPPTVPGAPTGVTATTSTATTAVVNFTPPVNNGGSPITSYTVTSSPGGITASGASSPITVSGLSTGTTYTFTVTATNAIGTGPASSPSNSVTPSALGNVLVNGSTVSSGTYIYNNSNTPNQITVSGGSRTVTFSLWGASGGVGSYSSGLSSGAGGFAKGTLTLQPGTTYYLYVGGQGFGPNQTGFGTAGLGGWPNGGFGTVGDASGGGGGGMTMLSTALFSTGMSDGNILLIAGGGGGSTGYAGAGGAGGGNEGQNAQSGPATRGTQSVGGTFNGAKLTGGNATGSRTSGSDDGGGGGGGYYGGGGGTSDANPGAGGSGYFNPSLVSSVTLTTGNFGTAPNPDSTLLANYASGKASISSVPQDGFPGLAYITF